MSTINQARGLSIWAISVVATGFGLLTIKEGGMSIAGNEAAVQAAGNYVPFVLRFQLRWTLRLSIVIAATTALVFAAIARHRLLRGQA